MTTKEKIKALRRLRWKNFTENYLNKKHRGLCSIYSDTAGNFSTHSLFSEIPELKSEGYNYKYYPFSWPHVFYHGTTHALHWLSRHKAINRTIKKLKTQL